MGLRNVHGLMVLGLPSKKGKGNTKYNIILSVGSGECSKQLRK